MIQRLLKEQAAKSCSDVAYMLLQLCRHNLRECESTGTNTPLFLDCGTASSLFRMKR